MPARNLVLLPVSIVAKVIIHIVVVIFNKIATNEDQPSFEDEFDKIIELKADRISLYVFFLRFILSMVPLVTDLPTYLTFLVLIFFGFLSVLLGRSLNYTFIEKEFNMGKDAISNHNEMSYREGELFTFIGVGFSHRACFRKVHRRGLSI
nr:hypothetical protein [Paenibacillus sp. SYP-B3998]